MYTPFSSRHFTTHIDPISKTKFAILSTHVAPIQQGFYFINSGWSDDRRFLWFYCAFPPASGHCAGVIDFLTDEIRCYPETAGTGWMVDHRSGNLYWGCPNGIYMRTPHPDDKPVLIAKMPEYCKRVTCASTHLTFTPDYNELITDIQCASGSVIGTFHIATGKFTKWYETKVGTFYDHAQMSPVDNDICMCAHTCAPNTYIDGIYPRLQIIRRDGSRKMVKPLNNYASHEWWAPDGKSIYYIGLNVYNGEKVGVIARDYLDGSEPSVICHVNYAEGSTWHGHCTKDQKYFVVDGRCNFDEYTCYRGCESTVHFYNAETGKLFKFLTTNPVVEGWSLENPCTYHIDPHPRFVLDDSMITFTTTVLGRVDLAVVSVDQLLEATK